MSQPTVMEALMVITLPVLMSLGNTCIALADLYPQGMTCYLCNTDIYEVVIFVHLSYITYKSGVECQIKTKLTIIIYCYLLDCLYFSHHTDYMYFLTALRSPRFSFLVLLLFCLELAWQNKLTSCHICRSYYIIQSHSVLSRHVWLCHSEKLKMNDNVCE